MPTPAMSLLLSHLPCFISLGVLAVILLLREHQNQAIQKGLLDRLLVSQGHSPLPEINPIADITGESTADTITEKVEQAVAKLRRSKPQPSSVRFQIPGMPQPKAGMGEVRRG